MREAPGATGGLSASAIGVTRVGKPPRAHRLDNFHFISLVPKRQAQFANGSEPSREVERTEHKARNQVVCDPGGERL